MVLAAAFPVLQLISWGDMLAHNQTFAGISAAFVYVLSGVHLAHIIPGLILIAWCIKDAGKLNTYAEGFILVLDARKLTRLKLATFYWHFLDAVWLVVILLFWLSAS
jgi:cytochrome c oxidase subunit 3